MDKKRQSKDVNVRKSLVRNVDVKVPNKVRVIPSSKSCTSTLVETRQNSDCNKFAIPKRHTSDILGKKLEKLENLDMQSFLVPSEIDTALINRQTTRKLNVYIDQNLYKTITALNIDDSHTSQRVRNHIRYTPSTSKDIEPNLNDFYNDVKECDKAIMVSAIKIPCSPVSTYNPIDLYEKIQSWNDYD